MDAVGEGMMSLFCLQKGLGDSLCQLRKTSRMLTIITTQFCQKTKGETSLGPTSVVQKVKTVSIETLFILFKKGRP